jgi:hypothetical protein
LLADSKGGQTVIFAPATCSYFGWHHRDTVGCHGNLFPQRFPPACPGWKSFVIAMLTLGASAVYLALMKHQLGNVLGGTLTFYLVTTAWATPDAEMGKRAFSIGSPF